MINFQNALGLVLKNTQQLNVEKIPVENLSGRILMEDIHSGLKMPPFDKSAMDGYAVIAGDLNTTPVILKSIGVIQAGDNFKRNIRRGECVKIMTGAALPAGCDSVVMLEHTSSSGNMITIFKKPVKGENVCCRGEDIKLNQRVLKKGTRISLSHIPLLAAVGRSYVKVVRKPDVGILNTGGEIVPAGYKLKGKRIYNCNGPSLMSLLKHDGIEPHSLGIAKDKPRELKQAIQKGLKMDILLISGGVSKGDYDLVPDVLKKLGVKIIFHTLSIKPGKPLLFGTKGNKLIFGIPGNPVANFLCYFLFIQPAMRKMAGESSYYPEFKKGLITLDFRQKKGRMHFVPARVLRKGNKCFLTPCKSHGSADILALSKADGFIRLEKDTAFIKKYTKIDFITWKEYEC